jgi:hypothetical protein
VWGLTVAPDHTQTLMLVGTALEEGSARRKDYLRTTTGFCTIKDLTTFPPVY